MNHETEVDEYMEQIMKLRNQAHDETRTSMQRARDMIAATKMAAVVMESQILDRETERRSNSE